MPTRDEVSEEVKRIIQATLKIDASTIQPSSKLSEDLTVSSLDLIEIVFAIEDAFGIRIPDDTLRAVQPNSTFDDVIDMIYRSMTEKQSTAF